VGAGVAGGPAPGPAPTFDANKQQFSGGVKTNFPTFKPRYSQTLVEGDYRNYGPPPPASNYGGTRNQQVYAQGGY